MVAQYSGSMAEFMWEMARQRVEGGAEAAATRGRVRDARRASPNIEFQRSMEDGDSVAILPTPPEDVLDPDPPIDEFERRLQSHAEKGAAQVCRGQKGKGWIT